jgi:hypothetical protein
MSSDETRVSLSPFPIAHDFARPHQSQEQASRAARRWLTVLIMLVFNLEQWCAAYDLCAPLIAALIGP